MTKSFQLFKKNYEGQKVSYIDGFGRLVTDKCIKHDNEVLFLTNGRIITTYDLESNLTVGDQE